MYKKYKVVMLATKKVIENCILKNLETNTLVIAERKTFGNKIFDVGIEGSVYNGLYQPQHLYVISNETIKEGDWYYTSDMRTDEYGIHRAISSRLAELANEFKAPKIIASTNKLFVGQIGINFQDTFLSKIPLEFVQEYVKNSSINEVLVECNETKGQETPDGIGTIESIYKLKVDSDNNFVFKNIKNTFTREEHLKGIYSAIGYVAYRMGIVVDGNLLDKWIEENL